ncbi:MAG TPA: Hint domain-containing protein [Anaerolineales bacterium]|nr:Hint domain-containing protein [Anaerolineales bacterium]
MKKPSTFTVLLAVCLSACAPIIPQGGSGVSTPVIITAQVSTVVASTVGPPVTQGPFPTPEPPTAIPPLPSAALSPTELKYKVLEQFPDFFFCDPDFYPIARDDEMSLAQQRFPELQADQEEFQAILNHNGLSGVTTFTADQKLLIYRDYKKLNAIYFQLARDKYQFQIQTGSEGGQGSSVTGTIDGEGSIKVQSKTASFPTCPICLAAGTLIDTPHGAVAVENLRAGDPVWTVNAAGERVVGKILELGSVKVPATHQVVHVLLNDGRELWASPGHPTADGRALGNLKAGERLGGSRIALVERLPYQGTATYDLLPSGGTGFYWANGILMGSTLAEHR